MLREFDENNYDYLYTVFSTIFLLKSKVNLPFHFNFRENWDKI